MTHLANFETRALKGIRWNWKLDNVMIGNRFFYCSNAEYKARIDSNAFEEDQQSSYYELFLLLGAKHHGLDKLGHVHLGIMNGLSGIHPSCAADLQTYLHQVVVYTPLEMLMPPSSVVGSVRFRRPTLHIFPAGQGDAALFGVSGFTILLDGGFSRKTTYWDFLRHVDRVDALLISRLSTNNVIGISSFVDRLATSECHPKLGYTFGNIPSYHRAAAASEEAPKNPLLFSLHEEGAKITEHLGHLKLKPHQCSAAVSTATKSLEPLTLYQKVGQGRLDMYVLNPVKDGKELNDFIDAWKKGVHKHGSSKFSTKPGSSGDFSPPLVDQTSIAALLVWRPADPNDQIIRVLYPGSCSQEKILQGLEKLKQADFLKHSTCTPASLESKTTTGSTAAPKKGLAVKAVEAVKSVASAVSPKAAVEAVKSAVGVAAPKAAVAPKSLASPKATAANAATSMAVPAAATAAPKAAEGIAREHHVEPPAAPIAPPTSKEPDLFELSPVGEPLIDVAPPPLRELSPAELATSPAATEALLGDFGAPPTQSPSLEPEHVAGIHAHNRSIQDHASPPGAETEDFIHREQVSAAAEEQDLLGMEREHHHHAGFGVAAEPPQPTAFEAVDVSHAIEPSVLRLSHDHLHDHAQADIVEEPSPVSPNQHVQSESFQHQHVAGQALDSPLEGGDRGIRAPAEPILLEHPHSLPVQDRSVEQKFGQQSPESPLLAAEQASVSAHHQQLSPRTQQRMFSLNPEAPVFIPKFGDLSPSGDQGFGGQHGSPMDPFSEKGFGDGTHVPKFSNGSSNPFDDSAWPSEAAASPKRAGGGDGANPFGDEAVVGQSSPEGHRKNVEDAMKEWGHPLGLPAPATKGPQNGTASATKSKANGPAAGANKDAANKSTTSSTTTTTKRTTTTTTARTPAAAGAAAKATGASADAKPGSSAATAKKSPTAAAPRTGTAAAKASPASAAPAKPASAAPAKPASAPASKPAATARPTSATATAPKPAPATAAPAKSTHAAKKAGPPGASYYVDLT